MAEPFILDRIKFNKKGTQTTFLRDSKRILDLTWFKFAQKLGVSTRTLTQWTAERLNMSFKAATLIAKLTKGKIPGKYIIIKWDNHLNKISTMGGRAVIAKYGKVSADEENRKDKWKDWWNREGKYKDIPKGFQSKLEIQNPSKSVLLAEFMGIMLGDGGVSKYYTSVTLSSEEKLYILFVTDIIKKLFGVNPKIYKHVKAKAVRIIVNRKSMVDFCQELGLVQGDKIKNQIDIPVWIKENKEFARACVRGLVDTDGCFYKNSYKIKSVEYSYFKIAFISASKPLVLSVAKILNDLNIKTVVNKNYRDVRIVGQKDVLKYVEEIGSRNDKHLQKIKEWKNSLNMLE